MRPLSDWQYDSFAITRTLPNHAEMESQLSARNEEVVSEYADPFSEEQQTYIPSHAEEQERFGLPSEARLPLYKIPGKCKHTDQRYDNPEEGSGRIYIDQERNVNLEQWEEQWEEQREEVHMRREESPMPAKRLCSERQVFFHHRRHTAGYNSDWKQSQETQIRKSERQHGRYSLPSEAAMPWYVTPAKRKYSGLQIQLHEATSQESPIPAKRQCSRSTTLSHHGSREQEFNEWSRPREASNRKDRERTRLQVPPPLIVNRNWYLKVSTQYNYCGV